jgi:hypothetical protein
MSISTLNRLTVTLVIGVVLVAISFAAHAQPPSEAQNQHPSAEKKDKPDQHDGKDDKKDEKDDQKAHQKQQRLTQQQQQERIHQQQQAIARYKQQIAHQQEIAQRNAQQLQQQKRMAHYRFQQAYNERIRQQQARLVNERYDYDNDPYYYTAPNYRYRRGTSYYETNQYGADILRQASNYGYQEGVQAGRADRQDNWRADYRQSFAYQDANYGYDGRYAQQDDYNYYFREGFQRGYDDGYHDRREYGRNTNGSDSLLSAVLESILNLQVLL